MYVSDTRPDKESLLFLVRGLGESDGDDGLNGEGVESGKAEKREEEVSSESSKDRLKPSILYDKYCEQYEENIEEEMKNMIKLSYPEDMMFKIKKTFKNRCYSIFSQK